MRKALILLLSLCILSPASLFSQTLSKEECMAIVKDLENVSNHNPQDVDAKARQALEQLRRGESLTSYFVAYNIYAENLFNRGKIDEAQDVIKEMLREAAVQKDAECKVIALRTEGQFYYKLGLYERAGECFRKGIAFCPRYDSDRLDHCFTWSSTLFWLVQADLQTGRVDEAAQWLDRMDGMMDWLETQGIEDKVGYKPVMIRGLKAKVALRRGDRERAVALLEECPQYMLPDVPSRAYVEYYVAKMQLALLDDNHEEALPLLDELIDMHISDYKPIAAEFLYQKGESLAHLGRYRESTETLLKYVELKDEVKQTALAEQLGELSANYELEKLQHERDKMRIQLAITFTVCLALAVLIALVVVSRKRLRRKNRTLANTISELNRLASMPQPAAPSPSPGDASSSASSPAPSSSSSSLDEGSGADSVSESDEVSEGIDDAEADAEVLETGRRVVEYINTSKCYLSPDCGRDTIKESLGVPERVLAKAMVAATGASFVNYINRLRLQTSINMLEERQEMTISDISTACGFGTVRQFQRIFKQHFDMTPSSYREARTTPSNPD